MIKLENVTYTYSEGGPFQMTAVDNVNLTINKDELVGLIGHTGSGKSTLIQMMNGLIKPTSGRVFVDGKELHNKKTKMSDIRFKVGLVMQYPEYQLFEETVYKDIAFGPTNMDLPDFEIKRRVEFACDAVGLERELLEKSPFDLSGGQKRRAAIAGVIAMQPEVLILDEPTAGLDPSGRDEILYRIRDMHRRAGMAVVLVSHSMEDIANMADRIVVMNKGKGALDGKPAEIFGRREELESFGLSVPQVTSITHKLREKGYELPKGIHTVSEAVYEIMKLKKGAGDNV